MTSFPTLWVACRCQLPRLQQHEGSLTSEASAVSMLMTDAPANSEADEPMSVVVRMHLIVSPGDMVHFMTTW